MNIKELREKLNFSQQKLSDITGIPKSRISQWELGNAKPKAADTNTLTKFFSENGVLTKSDKDKETLIGVTENISDPEKITVSIPLMLNAIDIYSKILELKEKEGHNQPDSEAVKKLKFEFNKNYVPLRLYLRKFIDKVSDMTIDNVVEAAQYFSAPSLPFDESNINDLTEALNDHDEKCKEAIDEYVRQLFGLTHENMELEKRIKKLEAEVSLLRSGHIKFSQQQTQSGNQK